ncbi:MAG: LamG domain-containing protein [Bacteroidia bacterium]
MRKRLSSLLPLLFAWFSVYSQSGNALNFDGTNDQVVCGLPSVFNNIPGNNFTIEAWVYPTGAVFSRIVFAQLNTTNFATLSTGGTNTIYFYVVASGTTYSLVTTATIPQNQWTHVAVTWNATTHALQCYFNGVLQTTAGGGSSSTGTSGIMTLGSRPGGAQYFPGTMDEVRIWSTIRSQCQIVGNMNRHFLSPQTNLVAYYDFNHGIAGANNGGVSILTDFSGGGYHGTLTNFALTGLTSNWIASTANVTQSGNAFNGYATTVNANVCSGANYTFPDGSTQSNITAAVTQTSTLTALGGCDSVVTTNLAVIPSYGYIDTVAVCSGGSVTFHDGTTLNGVVSDTSHTSMLQSVLGCDSVYDTYVHVLPNYNAADTVAVCPGGSVTYHDGSTDSLIMAPTSHTSTLATVNGCDSVIVTVVNLLPTYNQNETDTVCSGGDYTFPDGSVETGITATVVHTSALQTLMGCDSVIVTTVHPFVVDTSVVANLPTLTAQAVGATFQWIELHHGAAHFWGYECYIHCCALPAAVLCCHRHSNGCTDTSDCRMIILESVGTKLPA